MNLHIETFQRQGQQGGHIAVVAPEGALFSAGAVGGGDTERSAIIEAVNAYFTKLDAANDGVPIGGRATDTTFTVTLPAVHFTGGGTVRAQRVAVDEDTIERLLRTLYDEDKHAIISYRSEAGELTRREIAVAEFDRTAAGNTLVHAYDYLRDEPRHFRLDRIERAEEAVH